ncbi:hypothetical protein PF005_g25070 [Phytophthora fragariae]|uniref:Uncharacterized protein n=1 Tax=Phytophthora fragariae TaxID=53985 RepID=A0A6A3VZ98_9STRA|nr:hypothetical protein PF011_g24951 [Phytophthora fragariae]KAE9176196.1 hypothetical protein PF005_g25070 [Phytophthora fragariae]KAE9195629.1 hypothetical protein PF002_g23266 [Phytophthora fragariae]
MEDIDLEEDTEQFHSKTKSKGGGHGAAASGAPMELLHGGHEKA